MDDKESLCIFNKESCLELVLRNSALVRSPEGNSRSSPRIGENPVS